MTAFRGMKSSQPAPLLNSVVMRTELGPLEILAAKWVLGMVSE